MLTLSRQEDRGYPIQGHLVLLRCDNQQEMIDNQQALLGILPFSIENHASYLRMVCWIRSSAGSYVGPLACLFKPRISDTPVILPFLPAFSLAKDLTVVVAAA